MKDELIELSRLRVILKMTIKQVCNSLKCTEKSYHSWLKGSFKPSPIFAERINKLIVELRDKEFQENSGGKISKILLDVLSEGWFDKTIEEQGQRSFLAWRIARLSELKAFFKDDVYSENLVIKALESLCRKGLVKCFGVQAIDLNDFKFFLEIGKGEYSWSTGQPQIKRLYRDDKLSESELKSREITLAISNIVEKQEKERRAYFTAEHGRHQNLDGEITRQNYIDSQEKRAREDRLLEGIERLGKESKENG